MTVQHDIQPSGDVPVGAAHPARPVNVPGHWLWGNLRQFNADPLHTLLQVAQLGRLVHLRFVNQRSYLVHEPEDVKWVLVDNHRNYLKGYGTQALRPILGSGLLTSEDELHAQQRRLIQPAFHRQRIAAYAAIISRFADRHMAQWQDGQALDLHAELMHLTMMIVAQCLFDVDLSRSVSSLGDAISALILEYDLNRIGPIGQLIDRLDWARTRRRRRLLAVLDSLIYDMIRTRRAEGADHGDLLSMMLQMQDAEAGSAIAGAGDKQLRDELLTLFIAGHETTALAVTWTFYLLALHPEVEARLLEELTAVLGAPASTGEGTGDGAGARLPGWEDLPKLEYTRRVFSEAMRLYPPAWATARIARRDDEIAGCRIPAGSSVIVSQYVTHRDPRWWPDPERFDPDRFAPEAEAARPKFAYFPFGGGPRRCIGEPFAWMEGQLLVAALAQRFHFELQPGYAPELLPQVTLRPKHGMPMTVHARVRSLAHQF